MKCGRGVLSVLKWAKAASEEGEPTKVWSMPPS
jgi:hypothetical protein